MSVKSDERKSTMNNVKNTATIPTCLSNLTNTFATPESRSAYYRDFLIAVSNGSVEDQKKFIEEVPGMSFAFTLGDYFYLLLHRIITNRVDPTGKTVSENREGTNWGPKITRDYIVSLHQEKDMIKRNDVYNSVNYTGFSNKFTLFAGFDEEGNFFIALKDGGHRSDTIEKYGSDALAFTNPVKGEEYYNTYVCNKTIADDDVLEIFEKVVINTTFVPEDFNAPGLSNCKPFSHANRFAMDNKRHPLFLKMRNFLYENDIHFHKEIDENTYNALFILALLNNYNNGKTASVPMFIASIDPDDDVTIQRQIDLFDKFYFRVFIANIETLRSANISCFNISKIMSFVHTFTNYVSSQQGTFHNTVKAEYDALRKSKSPVLLRRDGSVKSLKIFMDEYYFNTRLANKHPEIRLLLAECVCDTIIMNNHICNTPVVVKLFEDNKAVEGAGHAGCETKAMKRFTSHLKKERAVVC